MTGDQFKALRECTGLSLVEFGRALGYQGNRKNVRQAMDRAECLGAQDINPRLAERAARLNARRSLSWKR